eukprot:4503141-Prymnesium_polylepis.1
MQANSGRAQTWAGCASEHALAGSIATRLRVDGDGHTEGRRAPRRTIEECRQRADGVRVVPAREIAPSCGATDGKGRPEGSVVSNPPGVGCVAEEALGHEG